MNRARVAAEQLSGDESVVGHAERVFEASTEAGSRWQVSSFIRRLVGNDATFLAQAWAAVFLLGAADLGGAGLAGLRFSGWPNVIFTVGFLAAIGLYYGRTGRDSRLADVGNFAALWIAFSAVGAVFTYVVATMRMPLQDARLAGIDAALGFYWAPWFHYIAAHRYLRLLFAIAYETMLPQIIGSILYLAHTRRTDRNRELLSIAMLSLILTTLISGIAPALGPYIAGHQPDFSLVLLTIRDGAATIFGLDNMKGIVTMPSFHTVIAIVLIYVHRAPSRSFPLVATLNGLMLLSVPSAGNHYLSDMIAGSMIAAISIAIVRHFTYARRVSGTSDDAIFRGSR